MSNRVDGPEAPRSSVSAYNPYAHLDTIARHTPSRETLSSPGRELQLLTIGEPTSPWGAFDPYAQYDQPSILSPILDDVHEVRPHRGFRPHSGSDYWPCDTFFCDWDIGEYGKVPYPRNEENKRKGEEKLLYDFRHRPPRTCSYTGNPCCRPFCVSNGGPWCSPYTPETDPRCRRPWGLVEAKYYSYYGDPYPQRPYKPPVWPDAPLSYLPVSNPSRIAKLWWRVGGMVDVSVFVAESHLGDQMFVPESRKRKAEVELDRSLLSGSSQSCSSSDDARSLFSSCASESGEKSSLGTLGKRDWDHSSCGHCQSFDSMDFEESLLLEHTQRDPPLESTVPSNVFVLPKTYELAKPFAFEKYLYYHDHRESYCVPSREGREPEPIVPPPPDKPPLENIGSIASESDLPSDISSTGAIEGGPPSHSSRQSCDWWEPNSPVASDVRLQSHWVCSGWICPNTPNFVYHCFFPFDGLDKISEDLVELPMWEFEEKYPHVPRFWVEDHRLNLQARVLEQEHYYGAESDPKTWAEEEGLTGDPNTWCVQGVPPDSTFEELLNMGILQLDIRHECAPPISRWDSSSYAVYCQHDYNQVSMRGRAGALCRHDIEEEDKPASNCWALPEPILEYQVESLKSLFDPQIVHDPRTGRPFWELQAVENYPFCDDNAPECRLGIVE